MSPEFMAPLMFASLILFLLIGYPVAFSLSAVGLLFAVIAIELGFMPAALLQALPQQVFDIMRNDTLLAIPFFTFMGLILERSGMAEDMLETIGQLFGRIRGGLAYAVIFVGALLAATTGVVAASVISMGLISLPIMMRYGYDARVASGVIAASGTLAQIIPPSLVLIVLADQLGTSVGDMYAGALVPGLTLVLLYVLYVFIVTVVRPSAAPALPPEARTLREDNGSSGTPSLLALLAVSIVAGVAYDQFHYAATDRPMDERIIVSALIGIAIAFGAAVVNRVTKMGLLSRAAEKVVFVMVPPLMLIFLVLGTIFLGVATPTEGGAMGAAGAIILAMIKGKLNLDLTRQAMNSTLKLTTFVVFILIGARVFRIAFIGVDGDAWVEHLFDSLPGGVVGFLVVVNILVFVLAFFLDFFEIAFIIVPLLAPIAAKLGIDLVWFGVMLGVNMQTSFMHPPFGFALFYLRSVAPKSIKTTDIYWGAIPFVIIQILMVALVIAFPKLVTHALHGPAAESTQTTEEVLQSLPQDTPEQTEGDGGAALMEGSGATLPAGAEPEPDPAAALLEEAGKSP
ncbi:TRAP transporter large permease [Chitinimonas sp. JJ19]|uniref:TRAP transporter large permease n=1 Tax=Chitinimonas sp. JJ19 TaxID=3109352 RepID=UPI0030027092